TSSKSPSRRRKSSNDTENNGIPGHEIGRGVAEDPDARAVRGHARPRHRASWLVCPADRAPARDVLVRFVRSAAVQGGREVRERHWLAELLLADRGLYRDLDRSQLLHDAHRGPLQPVRQPSRSCVPGWSATDRPALLHQRRSAEVRAIVVASGFSRTGVRPEADTTDSVPSGLTMAEA